MVVGVGAAPASALSSCPSGAACVLTNSYGTDTGKRFTLDSQATTRNYRDPKLSNGAGFDGAGVSFDGQIRSYYFLNCK